MVNSPFDLISSLGGCVGPLQLSFCAAAGRGVVTTAKVVQGEPLLRVPQRLALAAPDAACSSRRVTSIADALGLHEHEVMACVLLDRLDGFAIGEGDEETQRAVSVCMQALPSSFVPGPAWLWSEEQLHLLASPGLGARCRSRRAACERLATALHPLWNSNVCAGAVLPGRAPSASDVAWAVASITSRAMSAVTEAGGRVSALVPGCDLLNHRAASSVSFFFDSDRREFVIRADQEMPPGTEVTFCYAAASNAFMLEQYGFFEEHVTNPHDAVQIDVGEFFASNPDARAQCVRLGLLQTAAVAPGVASAGPKRDSERALRYQPAGMRLREAILQSLLLKNGLSNQASGPPVLSTAEQHDRAGAVEREWRQVYAGMLNKAIRGIDAVHDAEAEADQARPGTAAVPLRAAAAADVAAAPSADSDSLPCAHHVAAQRRRMARNFRASQRAALLSEAEEAGVMALVE
jgi:hypothetical protein